MGFYRGRDSVLSIFDRDLSAIEDWYLKGKEEYVIEFVDNLDGYLYYHERVFWDELDDAFRVLADLANNEELDCVCLLESLNFFEDSIGENWERDVLLYSINKTTDSNVLNQLRVIALKKDDLFIAHVAELKIDWKSYSFANVNDIDLLVSLWNRAGSLPEEVTESIDEKLNLIMKKAVVTWAGSYLLEHSFITDETGDLVQFALIKLPYLYRKFNPIKSPAQFNKFKYFSHLAITRSWGKEYLDRWDYPNELEFDDYLELRMSDPFMALDTVDSTEDIVIEKLMIEAISNSIIRKVKKQRDARVILIWNAFLQGYDLGKRKELAEITGITYGKGKMGLDNVCKKLNRIIEKVQLEFS